ncbi:hypothetical protein TPHA_0B03770 [Tetrapisispora phaffii CBS 4417]|uniref:Major facilitator superfamily (MFS) profile domain-containing protein n=1 Tax=Tetrapisispora phaffii (strain ATCC 24235 / CBS 4417 / NBRC 1672 / NRRL Y-8282 / UCD 70-5) TaxID=1071381 RepID=G8BPW8_TETPH|nr:hypothetical protein TPHA_0B03770 [Tetrapisispora phaffii CBS 4417]CCE62049.1 hypothetical protein TPHA_0B03770 [Tetrapisispora phaffii CBS 4417]
MSSLNDFDVNNFAEKNTSEQEIINSMDDKATDTSSRNEIDNSISDKDSLSSFEVKFDNESEIPDPEDIKRILPIYRKYIIGMVITLTSMVITIISSCWTLISDRIMDHFHISHEVSVLGISFYIFGLGVGPLFLSPLSELYGRRKTFIISLFFSIVWQCLVIWSKTIEGVMFGRFLSGFFGSAFLSVAGGLFTDIFEKKNIGIPITIYTTSPMLGPALGPIISGALHGTNYKWTFITMLLASGLSFICVILLVPETYEPVLLIEKAKRLRKETGDERFFAPMELQRRDTNLLNSIANSARGPFGLLIRDPMMATLCFYTGLVLAIVYLFFVAFPYIFETIYEFGAVEVGCAYVGLLVGILLASPTSFIIQKHYEKKVADNNGISTPEMRFEALYYGAFLTPIGLMIFCWTCYRKVHWIGPIIGSSIFGSGVFYVFTGVFSYTVDGYRKFSATAMACNSFVRSTMSAVFPLFGLQMYKGMGVNWAGFLIACITTAMIPVPFLFEKYGAKLRAKSPYAWDDN